jgi:hypothetical protein
MNQNAEHCSDQNPKCQHQEVLSIRSAYKPEGWLQWKLSRTQVCQGIQGKQAVAETGIVNDLNPTFIE